jgi:hypothetical protein
MRDREYSFSLRYEQIGASDLGADVEGLLVEASAKNLPRWLVPVVLQQWYEQSHERPSRAGGCSSAPLTRSIEIIARALAEGD